MAKKVGNATVLPGPVLESGLAAFFDDFAKTRGGLAVRLADFFTDYARVSRTSCFSHGYPRQGINSEQLASWLLAMEQPLKNTRVNAWRFDPWKIAGLGRDEVRNSRVLAWMLAPSESHGLGDLVLNSLREAVNSKLTDNLLPNSDRYCCVRTESNPSGEISDRVDIEIDADTFYLIIEVKIDASEGERQIERYCEVAEQRAGNRPWAVVFLTPKGKKAETAAHYSQSGRIVPMSWRAIAQVIRSALPTGNARQHASHQSIMLAINCFIKAIGAY